MDIAINKRNIIKRESIIGLPVIDGNTGKRLGIVKDFYTGVGNTHLEGLYVTQKGWGKKGFDILFQDITIGIDSVITEGNNLPKIKVNQENNENLKKLLKKKVVREDGQELGFISDIILDPLTGRIEGLELSESVIDDLITGRQVLAYQPDEYNKGNVIVVTIEQADNITSYNKGIKNIFLNKI